MTRQVDRLALDPQLVPYVLAVLLDRGRCDVLKFGDLLCGHSPPDESANSNLDERQTLGNT